MKLNYNEWLTLAFWEYNRYPDEELTRELFQETFGPVSGAHYYEKCNCAKRCGYIRISAR